MMYKELSVSYHRPINKFNDLLYYTTKFSHKIKVKELKITVTSYRWTDQLENAFLVKFDGKRSSFWYVRVGTISVSFYEVSFIRRRYSEWPLFWFQHRLRVAIPKGRYSEVNIRVIPYPTGHSLLYIQYIQFLYTYFCSYEVGILHSTWQDHFLK